MYKQWLYPTGDYQSRDCYWVHLDYFEDYLLEFKTLIRDEQMKSKIRKMYLNYIEKKLNQKHF